MPIAPLDFEYMRTFLYEKSGIVLSPGKEYLVESRLSRIARELHLPSIDPLIAKLRATGWSELHKRVIDSLTTNETSFFRDQAPWEALKKVVPMVLAKKPDRSLSLWCGAASSGQEPYTILMTLRESFPDLTPPKLRFLATDLSQEMLTRAASGKYNQLEINRGLPTSHLQKYFDKAGDEFQVKEALRKMVEFRSLNLVENWPVLPTFDIIFLRNVLIYFDAKTKTEIFGKLRRVMAPHTYLFLGCAETTFNLDDQLERTEVERATCYRLRSK